MSYTTPPDIVTIPGTPKLPNTSRWDWICCACYKVNYLGRETTQYSECRFCQHERCRRCAISWKESTVSCDDDQHTSKPYEKMREDETDYTTPVEENRCNRCTMERRERDERIFKEEEAVSLASRLGRCEGRNSSASEESARSEIGGIGVIGRMAGRLAI
ncbi:uncharacterized protein RCO7_08811 [Rhynchosporium graminicola]|uniref:Uncharacterized protein n=1 Tax=Rhynchosporium graminicola TaxID=2792576 RepID=A0A1E1KCT7_9HELO|nr:uncharacterized protein RCO7_08811 [Rhynchosporium commune]